MSNAKLTIDAFEIGVSVDATYNPKELSFEKNSGWSEDSNGVGADMSTMQFTNGKSIKMSLELFFDRYEQDGGDVRGDIAKLIQMTMIVKGKGRPPMVRVLWNGTNVLYSSGKFTGVVESVSTKYTMFRSNGVPCRATATVSLIQAEKVTANGSSDGTSVDSSRTDTYSESSKTYTFTDRKQMSSADIALAMAADENFDPAKDECFPVTYTADAASVSTGETVSKDSSGS